MKNFFEQTNKYQLKLIKIFLIAILGLFLSISIQIVPAKIIAQPDLAIDLVRNGKQYYDGGQYLRASQNLQQAAQIYQQSKELEKQAQTLGFLALTQEKLGQLSQANQTIKTSLNLLEQSRNKKELGEIKAQVYNIQGQIQLAEGKAESALVSWENAEVMYQDAQDIIGVIGSQINQTQALQSLGLYRQARKKLTQLEAKLDVQSELNLKAIGWHNLGEVRRLTGDLEAANELLSRSLAIAKLQDSSETQSQILLSLGNTQQALALRADVIQESQLSQTYLKSALNYYEQAVSLTNFPLTKIQAQLNQLSLLIDINKITDIDNLLFSIPSSLEELPASRYSIFALVNFGQSLIKIEAIAPEKIKLLNISQILNKALTQAQNLQDKKAESYVLGTLGKWYEQQQNWSKAEEITQSALILAQEINAAELIYQWQWQMGRLLQAQSQQPSPEAIAYYTQAFEILNDLRGDLVALNPEIQFSFRDSVEPVYRQLVALLLTNPNQENLIQARQVIEALQLAELDNFFRDACAQPKEIDIDNLDSSAAVIYPIILPNSLDVIFKLPLNKGFRYYRHPNITQTDIETTVNNLREYLSTPSTSQGLVKTEAEKIYNWLIRPFATDLDIATTRDNSQIKTLVFVLDGSLRNLPMSVLYDGDNYLIQRYAIAVTPGLQLIQPEEKDNRSLGVLVAGATDAPSFQQEGLAPLDNVQFEIEEVGQQLNDSQTLSNKDFTQENLQTQISNSPFRILHLATHGKFSSNPEETFILDWQSRINVKDLDKLLRTNELAKVKSLDLLILSACETAKGDDRAALGLAGVAIRAGANSTLASLWQVNDASTAELMIRFYEQISKPQMSKAEALRNVQLAFLSEYEDTDYHRPYYWASFILVGNWL